MNNRANRKTTRAERVKACFRVNTGTQAGVTRDVSVTGLYIELPEPYALGSVVPLEIQLETNGRATKLKLTGEVIRVESKSGCVGLGLKVVE